MKRTLKILAAGILGLNVGANVASAMPDHGASPGHRPAMAAPRPAHNAAAAVHHHS